MLLKMNLVHRPKVNAVAFCQSPEFFLPALVPQRPLLQLKTLASSGENRVGEKVSGTAGFQD
jgi:hypothetical protein